MNDFFAFFDSKLAKVISFIYGTLGLILAIVFYIKSKRLKRPVYYTEQELLIGGPIKKMENLEIRYKNNRVPRVTIATIAFWNSGSETIRGLDLTEKNAPKILVYDGANILDASIIFKSDITNNLTIAGLSKYLIENEATTPMNPNENIINAAYFKFDFLDKNDGAVFQIVHDGKLETNIRLDGKIIGCEAINNIADANVWSLYNIFHPTSFGEYVTFILISFGTSLIFFLLSYGTSLIGPETPVYRWFILFLVVFTFLNLLIQRSSVPMPNKYKKYFAQFNRKR